MRRRFVCRASIAVAALCLCGAALAQVEASGAWARATVAGQMGTGAFMTLTSKDGARLVGAASPVAGIVEIHEMAMDGNIMRMREVPALELAPGRAVELKPGGYHVMLMDLKHALKAGEKITIELRFETHDRKLVTMPIEAVVGTRAPASALTR
jgi:copper(I)-binding protein